MSQTIEDQRCSSSNALTVEGLIRSQLQGKSRALERYDGILWKIRAGYLAVLYSLLTLLSGNGFEIGNVLGDIAKSDVLLYTALSFSTCALIVDFGFLLSKLRVVEARNELSDIALSIATGKNQIEKHYEPLKALLHLSGESPSLPRLRLLTAGAWPIALFYITTPVTVAMFL